MREITLRKKHNDVCQTRNFGAQRCDHFESVHFDGCHPIVCVFHHSSRNSTGERLEFQSMCANMLGEVAPDVSELR